MKILIKNQKQHGTAIKLLKNSFKTVGIKIFRQSRIARPQRSSVCPERRTVAGNYRGNNFVTPSKTPAKQTSSTVTKEKRPVPEKKWIIEESAKIFEYLKELQVDIGKDFYNRSDGIRSMSTKELVIIINYFLVSLGQRLEIKSTKDYVEETIKSLEKIKYPYNLAKSTLKTPTASHSIANIIQLLSWLQNLHKQTCYLELEDDDLLVFREDAYPNLDCQKCIQSVATESFKIWNSNQGEEEEQFDDIESKAVDKIIYESTALATTDVLRKSEQNWKKFEDTQKEIENIKMPEEQEQKYFDLVKEYESNQNKIHVLELQINAIEKEISDSLQEHDLLQKYNQELVENYEKLEKTVNGQKASVQERDNQIHKVLFLEGKVNAAKNTLKEVINNSSNIIVIETRLISKMPIMIGKLKDFLNTVQDITKSEICFDVDLEDKNNFKGLYKKIKDIKNALVDLENTNKEVDGNLKNEILNCNTKLEALNKHLNKEESNFDFLIENISKFQDISKQIDEQLENNLEIYEHHLSLMEAMLHKKQGEHTQMQAFLKQIQISVSIYFSFIILFYLFKILFCFT